MVRHILSRSALGVVVAIAFSTCGCSFFPEALQPQNLQKLNRGPGPSRDPFFSIPDHMPSSFQASDPFAETSDDAEAAQAQ